MLSVYLIDDEKLILNEIIDMVPWLDNGFEVIGSNTDPEKAFEEIMELKPDVVFCDMRMPKMDGNELISKLRAEGNQAEYVIISAYDDFESVRAFYKQDGYDYLLKPVKADNIQMVLMEIAEKLSGQKNDKALHQVVDNAGFNQMVEYINAHFTEKITLALLSDKFGFSKNYICNLFNKYYKIPLNLYLTNLRMEYAMDLLKDKSIMIKEVAHMTGYNDYYNFFRVFKKKCGMSPKEMRERME